jgi:hypothetical protein
MKNKNNKLLKIENHNNWNNLMNLLSKCPREEELSILKQINKLNEEFHIIEGLK